MRPANFRLLRPASLGAALELLHGSAQRSTVVMAGGQSLLKDLRERKISPQRIVDLALLEELRFIRHTDERIEIGALTTVAELILDERLRHAIPALVNAARTVGDRQIRNRATIGGNLLSGWSSDLGVVACAGRADVVLMSVRGQRTLSAASLVADGCAADEIVRTIAFPRSAHSAFEKLSRRYADPSLASAAAFAWLGSDDISLAIGGAHSHPIRLATVERIIARDGIDSVAVSDALKKAAGDLSPPATPHGSAEYRRRIVPTIARRALEALPAGGCA